jgi:hypothetical protein
MDCFDAGRLSGTKGTVWQCTAADVASGYASAFLKSLGTEGDFDPMPR